MCLALGPQKSDADEARTRGLSVLLKKLIQVLNNTYSFATSQKPLYPLCVGLYSSVNKQFAKLNACIDRFKFELV